MNERLQSNFLDLCQQKRLPVTVFVTNGFQLKGQILDHGKHTILLDVDGRPHLVYKHAVSTIVRREG